MVSICVEIFNSCAGFRFPSQKWGASMNWVNGRISRASTVYVRWHDHQTAFIVHTSDVCVYEWMFAINDVTAANMRSPAIYTLDLSVGGHKSYSPSFWMSPGTKPKAKLKNGRRKSYWSQHNWSRWIHHAKQCRSCEFIPLHDNQNEQKEEHARVHSSMRNELLLWLHSIHKKPIFPFLSFNKTVEMRSGKITQRSIKYIDRKRCDSDLLPGHLNISATLAFIHIQRDKRNMRNFCRLLSIRFQLIVLCGLTNGSWISLFRCCALKKVGMEKKYSVFCVPLTIIA